MRKGEQRKKKEKKETSLEEQLEQVVWLDA